MSSAERVRKGSYTEADVLALYMKYRESGLGPFTREVGDFIAHAKRNRGATLDTTAYVFSQMAFFQTYQSDRKKPLEAKGPCGWWLRHYLLAKTKEATETEIQRAIGLTKKQVKNAIKSWFHGDSVYPTSIKCNDPELLYKIAQMFARMIRVRSVFELGDVKAELAKMFESEEIDHNEFDRFLIATSVLLRGKSVEIVPGVTAEVKLSIGNARFIPLDENGIQTADKPTFVRALPDGNLTIIVSTNNQTGDGLIGVGSNLLDTGIDTETYFSRALVEVQHHIPRLRLDQPLSFDTRVSPPVS